MKKKTLILHVGWSKTGTSAVQKAIHHQHNDFLQAGILYPKAIQWNDHSHHKFSLAFRENSGYSSEFTSDMALQSIAEEMTKNDCESVLISSELSPFYFDFENFKKFAREHFDQVKVMFTVRRQSELILSLFNQLTKDQSIRYPGTLFSLTMNNMLWMDFSKQINKWASVVGEENIIVFPYSKTIVHDVFDFFNIEFKGKSNEQNESVNVSIPHELLPAVKAINVGVIDERNYKLNMDKVTKRYSELKDKQLPAVFFSIPEQQGIDKYFQLSNEQVAKKYLTQQSLFEQKQYKPVKFIPLHLLNTLHAQQNSGK